MKRTAKIYLLLILVIIASCKKETPYYKIPDYMKQYFVFQKGSYWIYINDSTKEMDSTYVNNVIYATQGIGDDGRDLYSFDLITLYFTSQFFIYYEMGNICEETVPKLMMELKQADFNPYIIAFIEGTIPKQIINTKCGSPSGNLLYDELPSIVFNNITYYNILHTTITTEYKSQVHSFYFAKNIGLLQYQCKINNIIQTSWSLQRCNVIQ